MHMHANAPVNACSFAVLCIEFGLARRIDTFRVPGGGVLLLLCECGGALDRNEVFVAGHKSAKTHAHVHTYLCMCNVRMCLHSIFLYFCIQALYLCVYMCMYVST